MKTVCLLLLLISLPFLVLGQTKEKSPADPVRQNLLKLTDEITTAKSKKDVTHLEKLLTEEFILTNPAGFVADRSEYLDGVKADTATYESVTNHDRAVSVSNDAAVVTGSTVVKGRYDGHEIGGGTSLTTATIKR